MESDRDVTSPARRKDFALRKTVERIVKADAKVVDKRAALLEVGISFSRAMDLVPSEKKISEFA